MSSTSTSTKGTKSGEKRHIDLLLGSATRVDVLWQFLINSEEWLGPTILSRLTGRNLRGVQREIKTLYNLGLLEPKIIGGYGELPKKALAREWQNPWRINKNHPWVPALRMLLEQSIGSLHVLHEKLQKLDGIEVAFVYGSFATSTQTPESDIDLMVIGRQTLKTIAKPISDLEKRTGREINVITHTPQAWRKKFRERNHFVVSLMETPKIFISGDLEKLEKITAGDQNEI